MKRKYLIFSVTKKNRMFVPNGIFYLPDLEVNHRGVLRGYFLGKTRVEPCPDISGWWLDHNDLHEVKEDIYLQAEPIIEELRERIILSEL